MKKILGAVTAVAILAPSLALAQASANLYGRLDASLNYRAFGSTAAVGSTPAKADSHFTSISSDTSYWGIVGKEDLGDGRKAYFKMESGINVDNGTQVSPTLFNRESYVGLGDANLGSIEVGSFFGPGLALSGELDPFQRSNLGGQHTLMQTGSANLRGYTLKYDNTIRYVSPLKNPLVVRVYVSLGEGVIPGPNYASYIRYANGAWVIGSTYDKNRVTAVSLGLTGATVTSQTLSLASKYATSFGSLNAWYQTNRVPGLVNADAYMIGATILAGPGEIRTSVARETTGTAKASLAAIGYFYPLSKRTMLYAAVGRLNNQSTTFSMWPTYNEAASMGLPGKGQSIAGSQLGIRTFF